MPEINVNVTERSIESDRFSAKAQIAVIGVGALGSEFCVQFCDQFQTYTGIEVLMIDPDVLLPKNVTLSGAYSSIVRFCGNDVYGEPKVELLSVYLKASSQGITFVPYYAEIADIGWQDLCNCNLLVTCTDSALSRAETAFISQSLGIPMIDGGVLGSGSRGGRVSSFKGDRANACYLCGISEDRRATMLAYAASVNLGCTVAEGTTAMDRSDATIDSIHHTAARLVEAIADALNGKEKEHSWAMRLIPSESQSNSSAKAWCEEQIELKQSYTCPWHENRMNLVAVLPEGPLRESLPAAEEMKFQLPWPVCLTARCMVCGNISQRPQRLASLRRIGSCAKCGAESRMSPIDSITSVGRRDLAAEMTPRQLGLPPRHLLPVRRPMKNSWEDREAS